MHLYLVRHGQSYVNLSDWEAPSRAELDAGLTELGQQQAAAVAQWLVSYRGQVDAIYASTMRRARETAQAIAAAYQMEITWHDYLREIGNNRTNHTPFPNDALPTLYRPFATPFTPLVQNEDDGETWYHARGRAGLFLQHLLDHHVGQTIIAVAHGGIISAIFDNICNIPMWRQCNLWIANTSITYFEYVDRPHPQETWRLHYLAREEHLAPLRETL